MLASVYTSGMPQFLVGTVGARATGAGESRGCVVRDRRPVGVLREARRLESSSGEFWGGTAFRGHVYIARCCTVLYYAPLRVLIPHGGIGELACRARRGRLRWPSRSTPSQRSAVRSAYRSFILLRKLPIFDKMELACLEDVASRLEAVKAQAGEHVVRAGDPGDSMYFINAGEVQVMRGGRER